MSAHTGRQTLSTQGNSQSNYNTRKKGVQMKNKTINALLEMGAPANTKGFQYIVDAMCLFEDESWRSGKLMAVYWKLAEMHGDTYSRVERSIRHAFSVVITKGDLNAVEKYLTLQNTTNGNLLKTLYLRLSQEGENENN